MPAMWVETVLQVGDEQVGVSIERLEHDEQERTAVALAWLTLEACRAGIANQSVAWHDLVGDLLRDHVAFTVPETRIENLGPAWWNEAMGRALVQFVRQNDLGPRINRHLAALQDLDSSGLRES
jgi:hypothetical protein